MHYAVTHQTNYTYHGEVSVSHHLVRVTPRALPHQQVLHSVLEVEPAPAARRDRTDSFGNSVTLLIVEGVHRQLRVVARSRVEVIPQPSPPASATLAWERVRDRFRSGGGPDWPVMEFALDSPMIRARPEYAEYAASSFWADRPLLEAVLDLTGRLHRDLTFDPHATTVATPVEAVFRDRRGVCQDFAHLAIACLRSIGLPARYVSGYLETVPPPGQERLLGADASHAWLSVYLPDHGWVDVDPTNNLLPADQHITVAWGRDYTDVSPIRGVVLGSGGHSLEVGVDMIRAGPSLEEESARLAQEDTPANPG
jgi:transglutaminase-like putative cysteine protease